MERTESCIQPTTPVSYGVECWMKTSDAYTTVYLAYVYFLALTACTAI
jgi:hypothetical protein